MKRAKQGKRARMMRIVAIILAILMVLTVVYSTLSILALAEGDPGGGRTSYRMTLAADMTAQALLATETIDYVNATGRPLTGVYLNVYANTLRRREAVPVGESEWDDVFSAGYAPGGVDFLSVKVNGESAVWAMCGAYEQFMYVECEVGAGERTQIELRFTLLLPWNGWDIGAGAVGWRLNGFCPSVALYDPYAESFALVGWPAGAAPLTGDAADYDVTVSVPRGYTVGATGGAALEAVEDGMARWRCGAAGARDFSFVLSRRMNEASGETGSGLRVTALATTAAAARAMRQDALDAMAAYESLFGPCPIDALTVAETDLTVGACRTGLIEVPAGLCALRRRSELRDEIFRLCAGQYFGVAVGCNTENEPWLRDALADYAFLLACEQREGRKAYLKRLNAQVLPALRITLPGGLTVDSAASRFSSRQEYEIVVIDRGAAALHETREQMGREAFIEGLALYVGKNAGRTASVGDLVAAFNEVTGERWDEYVVGQLHTISDYVDQRITWFE